MHDRPLRQQRRRVIVVHVLLHPVMVVADAVERLDVVAPDRFEAHAHAGRVQVRFERDVFRVLLQHRVGVQLLAGFVGPHVDVAAVAQPHGRSLVGRLVALRKKLEREFEMALRLAAVRVQMPRVQRERRVRRKQAAGLRRKEIRVAADLMNRPAAAALVGAAARALALDDALVGHVVEDVASADRRRRFVVRDVVDLADLDGRHIAILGQARRNHAEVAPVIGTDRRHGHVLRCQDQIGLADRPFVAAVELERLRHVGWVTARRAAVHPCCDHRDLGVAERRIVLELLDADILLDEERWHGAALAAQGGAHLDRLGPRPHVFVGDERHRCDALGVMALLTAALQDGRDVFREGHAAGRYAGRLRDRCGARDACDTGDRQRSQQHAEQPKISWQTVHRHGGLLRCW